MEGVAPCSELTLLCGLSPLRIVASSVAFCQCGILHSCVVITDACTRHDGTFPRGVMCSADCCTGWLEACLCFAKWNPSKPTRKTGLAPTSSSCHLSYSLIRLKRCDARLLSFSSCHVSRRTAAVLPVCVGGSFALPVACSVTLPCFDWLVLYYSLQVYCI